MSRCLDLPSVNDLFGGEAFRLPATAGTTLTQTAARSLVGDREVHISKLKSQAQDGSEPLRAIRLCKEPCRASPGTTLSGLRRRGRSPAESLPAAFTFTFVLGGRGALVHELNAGAQP